MATTVAVRNGDVDGALKVLKQKNAKAGSLKKIRERQEGFMKKGAKNRLAKQEAIKKSRKKKRGE